MKISKIILSITALFLLAVVASALVGEVNNGFYGTIDNNGNLVKTTQPITDFNAIGFVCANDDCSVVNGTLWNGLPQNSGNDNQLNLTYPTVLQQKGYGIFFYKEGYFPYEAKVDYAGNFQAASADNYFTQKESCQVPINDMMITHVGNKVIVNVTLSSDVSSPVQHAGPLNYVPDSIKHLYAVDANVTFTFIGKNNLSLTEDVNLPASEHKRVSVNTLLDAGYYDLIVESNSNDVKCLFSNASRQFSNLLIEDNRTNVTLPTIAIINPEAKIYTNNTILINLRSTNATSVWFNYNGTNITYNQSVYIDFANGSYVLHAYAANNATVAHTSVAFTVNTTVVVNQSDTTPPASITNLMLVSRSKNSLSWNWTSPSDADFSEAIIYIDGLNVQNTTLNYFDLSAINANTDYTITVHTKDLKGNINSSDVSMTSRTLANEGSSGGNGGHSSSNKKPKIINDTLEDAVSPTPVYHQQQELVSDRMPKKAEKDYSYLILILFLCSLVLLLVILVLLLSKR